MSTKETTAPSTIIFTVSPPLPPRSDVKTVPSFVKEKGNRKYTSEPEPVEISMVSGDIGTTSIKNYYEVYYESTDSESE